MRPPSYQRPLPLSLALGALLAVACSGGDDKPSADAGVTEPDAGGDDLPARISDVAADLTAALYECPDRVWPGLGDQTREAQVLLVWQSRDKAYLWNDQSADEPGTVTEVDVAELGPEWKSFFAIETYRDALTVGVDMDATGELNDQLAQLGIETWHDFALTMVFHEGFHAYGQENFQPGSYSRAVDYPEAWEPRYVRAMIVDALRAQVAASDPALGEAAFWQARYASEHADDAAKRSFTDPIEGSAEYATAMMSAIADRGCEASDAELRQAIAEHIAEFGFGDYDGESESYELGVVAGLALDAVGPEDWKSQVEGGLAPTQVLLGDVTSEEQSDHEDLKAEVMSVVATRNEERAVEVDGVLFRLADADHYRMPLSTAWVQGSFSTDGFLRLIEQDGEPEMILNVSASFSHPGGQTVVVEGQSTIQVESPCVGGPGTTEVVTLPVDEVSETGGVFTSEHATVSFTDLPLQVQMQDELAWLCPPSAGAPSPAPRAYRPHRHLRVRRD